MLPRSARPSPTSTGTRGGRTAPPSPFLGPALAPVFDDRLAARATDAAPARPEDHREEGADRADDQEDDADRVDVEAVAGDMHGEREHGPDGDQQQADSDTHSVSPFARGAPLDAAPAPAEVAEECQHEDDDEDDPENAHSGSLLRPGFRQENAAAASGDTGR